jgi:Sulfotransferase family
VSEPDPTLPSFFVIGAPKCGTTSLHHYLDQHPEVAMTTVKEPQLFAGPEYDPARLEEYAGLFRPGAAARGESSAVYSQFPRWPGVAKRIAEAVPGARFLYLVGDPIDRALAHYSQLVNDGKEARPIEDALADWRADDSLYLCPSRYATQLGQYLEHFDRDTILVVDQCDLLDRRPATLARVFEFLGVDPGYRSPRFTERLNARAVQRPETALGRRVRGTRAFGAVRRAPLPDPARRALRRLVSRPVARPTLEPEFRAELADSLGEEVAWLRSFAGQEFASWSL